MISPTAFEKNGNEWSNYSPVGTGPFKMVKEKKNTYLKFEKFQDYITKAMSCENRDEINDFLRKAEKLAYDDAIVIPVTQSRFCALNQPYVKDAYWFWAGAPYPNLSRTWLDK